MNTTGFCLPQASPAAALAKIIAVEDAITVPLTHPLPNDTIQLNIVPAPRHRPMGHAVIGTRGRLPLGLARCEV